MSQVVIFQTLTIRKMEAAGIEPVRKFEAIADSDSTSVKCSTCGAAPALHSCGTDCLSLSPLDADLQAVIEAWDGLPTVIRQAILVLTRPQGA